MFVFKLDVEVEQDDRERTITSIYIVHLCALNSACGLSRDYFVHSDSSFRSLLPLFFLIRNVTLPSGYLAPCLKAKSDFQ